ncbi:uncharacterized protein LOC117563769 [Drosophila albomicans]|uniref:Uncharacterized protein LOC117563769 n=1 Tax=Drosophila albomicans TaxID=7291 RepID=A0A6P8XG12_DROAB|nr:uncharacterized protein LOC117563769 [Drosophila albomicans]
MFKKSVLSLLLVVTCLALAAATQDAAARKAAPVQVQPRLLWLKRGESQQQSPIVIVQQPQDNNSNRHHYQQPPPPPYWSDYYSYPPQRPQRPQGLSDYPTIVIVNPNNAQNFTFDLPTTTAASTRRRSNIFNRRSSNPIVDLLQDSIDDDSEVISAADNVDNDGVITIPQQIPQPQKYAAEERNEELGDDELALLERQAERGLSPKNLISFLMQDKQRRRVQEAIAGIYLRNYNLNRK